MKVIRMPVSVSGGTQFAQVTSATMANRGDGIGLSHAIKVVKLAPTPMASTSQQHHQIFQTRVSQVKLTPD